MSQRPPLQLGLCLEDMDNHLLLATTLRLSPYDRDYMMNFTAPLVHGIYVSDRLCQHNTLHR
jgi:hypothetical protein